MRDAFSDQYWQEEFAVTAADLERLAEFIRQTQCAHDLTTLAQRIVRGRLRYGVDLTDPAFKADSEAAERVRLWDPAASWEPGDRVIVAIGVVVEGKTVHSPYVGEVLGAQDDNKIRVQIDALGRHEDYKVVDTPENLLKWREYVEKLVATRRGTRDEKSQVEYVLLRFGELLVSELVTALKHDTRFTELNGRWFLHELAVLPTEAQLASLAWAMLALDAPQPTADLVPLIQPPLAVGDAGLFGLYLTLQQHPEIFENADPGLRPRWRLVGPPPGDGIARHAAYAPETYAVLCMPGEPLTPELVVRLWQLGLLRAVTSENLAS